jgi:hypothetical protein
MRWLPLVLVACTSAGTGTKMQPASCPPPDPGISGDSTAGTACAASQAGQLCFVDNEFSSCASAWYRCDAGTWTFDHGLGAEQGQSCAGAPVDSCSTEGNPSCDTAPTSQWCGCGGDAVWHCQCACYGGITCPLACPEMFPGVGSNGPACADAGSTCTYPGHTCTCTAGHFSCQ